MGDQRIVVGSREVHGEIIGFDSRGSVSVKEVNIGDYNLNNKIG